MTIVTITSGDDTYMGQFTADTNYETDTTTTGVGEQNNAANARKRYLVRPDLSSIPPTAKVSSVFLSVYTLTSTYSSNNRTAHVYRVMRDWVPSEATWNIWSAGNSWSTPGAGSDGNDADLSTSHGSESFAAADAVGTEQQFSLSTVEFTKLIDGTYPYYGFLLIMEGESNDAHIIYTYEEAVETARKPKLVVTYTSASNMFAFF